MGKKPGKCDEGQRSRKKGSQQRQMLLRCQEEKEGKCPLDAEKKKADQFI